MTNTSAPVRTRFAPSPTGYLHIGGARTALFSWAFARHHNGKFVLRIEDTDLERSTQESTDAILESMDWLGLNYDEGPFYQTKRMDRYREAIQQLLDQGDAYYCYTTKEELEQMREEQRARGEKPRYDGRCRNLTAPPPNAPAPVIRFKNPLDGEVVWDDMIKGQIRISNKELDDLIIARADGSPTYNFCVVIDDWDMGITHVLRGDDHVSNTPRQINILKALGAPIPVYGHLPMILGNDGERLSKRHGAVSVTQYKDDGFLPEALLNYLARLGWSHGDDEIFSMDQFVEWFDTKHINNSPAQFNIEKLRWVNSQYIKQAEPSMLREAILSRLGAIDDTEWLDTAIALYKDRVETLNELADEIKSLRELPALNLEELKPLINPDVLKALAALQSQFAGCEWNKDAIKAAIKQTMKDFVLKMPMIAMPLRVMLLGKPHTPSIDTIVMLCGRDKTLARMTEALAAASS